MCKTLSVLAGLIFLLPIAASAQTYVPAECRPFVSQPMLRFDNGEHQLWYRRFWNGDCSGLLFCSAGTPNWNAAIGDIVQRTPKADHAAVMARACRLGQLVGLEWARDNLIRKIDTAEISKFYSELNGASDIKAALTDVEQQAHSDVGR